MLRYDYINLYVQKFAAKNYLEIGVFGGGTFFNVHCANKVAVDPKFLFDVTTFENSQNLFFQVTSEDFFDHANILDACAQQQNRPTPCWDIIFIDGLHTYEQSLRDFENSLPYSHDRTIWLLHDTLPADPYSAMPDMDLSQHLQSLIGYNEILWFGDVYKTVLAIHETHPEISYCTILDPEDVPMTILWKAPERPIQRFFPRLADIRGVSYVDLIAKYLHLMNLREASDTESLIGAQLTIRPDKKISCETALWKQRETRKEAALLQALTEQNRRMAQKR